MTQATICGMIVQQAVAPDAHKSRAPVNGDVSRHYASGSPQKRGQRAIYLEYFSSREVRLLFR